MSSFRVVTIVNEPVPIVQSFINWYRAAGASRIALYFDNPDDPAIDLLQGQPDLVLMACTPEFWLSVGMTQDTRFTARQNAALTHGYLAATENWVLAVDADELIYCPDQPIGDILAGQNPDLRSLVIQPAEYVKAPEPGAFFRIPITLEQVRAVYGPYSGVFRKRNGLMGHCFGKSFHRGGQKNIRLRQHWAVDTTTDAAIAHRALGHADRAYLLHYVAPDYAIWAAKLEWRVAASGYVASVKALLDEINNAYVGENAQNIGAAHAELYRRTHCLDAEQLVKLRQMDGILTLPEARFGPVQLT